MKKKKHVKEAKKILRSKINFSLKLRMLPNLKNPISKIWRLEKAKVFEAMRSKTFLAFFVRQCFKIGLLNFGSILKFKKNTTEGRHFSASSTCLFLFEMVKIREMQATRFIMPTLYFTHFRFMFYWRKCWMMPWQLSHLLPSEQILVLFCPALWPLPASVTENHYQGSLPNCMEQCIQAQEVSSSILN